MDNNETNFWNVQENLDFFKPIKEMQEESWKEIVKNWGISSVQLKHYLKTYYNGSRTYCYKDENININYILPYRNNGLYFGKMANYRLYYAMMAKAVLMIKLDTKTSSSELEARFRFEVLSLFLRIDSRKTNLSWNTFVQNTVNIWYQANTKFEETYNKVVEKCKKYKPKRKQTMYHYAKEDFSLIDGMDFKLSEAYNFWTNNCFNSILDNYKYRMTKLWIAEQDKNKNTEDEYARFKADLDLIKIKKLSSKAFRQLLDKYNIKYVKRNSKDSKDE